MFLLAGALMTRGAIAQRLINVMIALTAPVPGGLAVAAVLACAVFAAISGSSIVTMLAIGTIMYPGLLKAGYDRAFSIGLICSAGTLGIMIPPSIPMILYGLATETSITQPSLGGIGPGLLLTVLLRSTAAQPAGGARPRRSRRAGLPGTARRIFAMLLPFCSWGHLFLLLADQIGAVSLVTRWSWNSSFTATQARDYGSVLLGTTKMLGTLLPLIAIANSLNTISRLRASPRAGCRSCSSVSSPVMVMVSINILLLIVGCLMDVGRRSHFGPCSPIAKNAGFDPCTSDHHDGQPWRSGIDHAVGLNLIVAMAAFRESFGSICRAVIRSSSSCWRGWPLSAPGRRSLSIWWEDEHGHRRRPAATPWVE
jgi:C4-dicarboxylate transporter DctM subunit